jgi:hypothetical protein
LIAVRCRLKAAFRARMERRLQAADAIISDAVYNQVTNDSPNHINQSAMTMYQVLAELTLIIHLLFILFVVAGGFFARRWWWLMTIHLIAIAWAIYVEIAPGIVCPLTALENHFADRAGLTTYKEDFVARYLVPIIYPDQLGPALQYVLVGLVVVINLVAYSTKRRRVI